MPPSTSTFPSGALLGAVLLAACGTSGKGTSDGGPSFGPDALLTLASDSGTLHLEVRTSPQPPVRGVFAVEYRVTGSGGAAVDGLTLEVTPFMPAMGHGSSTTPTVAAQGGGRYLVTDVYIAMAGTCELRTKFSGAVTDTATPSFDVK
jgi:hypothetical protein